MARVRSVGSEKSNKYLFLSFLFLPRADESLATPLEINYVN